LNKVSLEIGIKYTKKSLFWQGLKSLIFEALGLEKLKPKVARLSSAQA
jgi:hypothetical protein